MWMILTSKIQLPLINIESALSSVIINITLTSPEMVSTVRLVEESVKYCL